MSTQSKKRRKRGKKTLAHSIDYREHESMEIITMSASVRTGRRSVYFPNVKPRAWGNRLVQSDPTPMAESERQVHMQFMLDNRY